MRWLSFAGVLPFFSNSEGAGCNRDHITSISAFSFSGTTNALFMAQTISTKLVPRKSNALYITTWGGCERVACMFELVRLVNYFEV
jgi:hypothetical protein